MTTRAAARLAIRTAVAAKGLSYDALLDAVADAEEALAFAVTNAAAPAPRGGEEDRELSAASTFLRTCAPPLDGSGHKGSGGRVGILGGSKDYTGAPYYAGMASLRAGSELVYMMTALEAAGPIKAYSPELMVTPVYVHARLAGDGVERAALAAGVGALLPKLHVLVLGPGLGRNAEVLEGVADAIIAARSAELPLVIDADGLWLIARRPDLVRNYPWAVLTPNAREYAILAERVTGRSDATVEALCDALGGVTIVKKGAVDVIANGVSALTQRVEGAGAPRRCGGLGDFLAGTIGTFAAWAKHEDSRRRRVAAGSTAVSPPLLLEACAAACVLVRRSCSAAYQTHKRSMTAPDVLATLGGEMAVMEEGAS